MGSKLIIICFQAGKRFEKSYGAVNGFGATEDDDIIVEENKGMN